MQLSLVKEPIRYIVKMILVSIVVYVPKDAVWELMYQKDTVTSGECINCMQCLTICPRESLSASPKGAVAGTTAATMIGGMVIVGNITSANISNLAVSESTDSEPTVLESAVSESTSTEDISEKKQNGKY